MTYNSSFCFRCKMGALTLHWYRKFDSLPVNVSGYFLLYVDNIISEYYVLFFAWLSYVSSLSGVNSLCWTPFFSHLLSVAFLTAMQIINWISLSGRRCAESHSWGHIFPAGFESRFHCLVWPRANRRRLNNRCFQKTIRLCDWRFWSNSWTQGSHPGLNF